MGDIRSGGSLYVRSKVLNNLGRDYDPDGGGYYGYNTYWNLRSYGNILWRVEKEERLSKVTLRTKQGVITAKNNIDIKTDDFYNRGSVLQANNSINIEGNVSNNTSSIFVTGLQIVKCSWKYMRSRCKLRMSMVRGMVYTIQ